MTYNIIIIVCRKWIIGSVPLQKYSPLHFDLFRVYIYKQKTFFKKNILVQGFGVLNGLFRTWTVDTVECAEVPAGRSALNLFQLSKDKLIVFIACLQHRQNSIFCH